jgi:hypothetical protein
MRLIAAAIALVCLTLAQSASAVSWTIQPTPNPPGAQDSALEGVSCPSRTACIAVGHDTSSTGAGASLAERWNGHRWTIQSPPPDAGASSLLFDVSCMSPRMCMAVGSSTTPAGRTVPLADRWNGVRWTITRPRAPSRSGGPPVSYLGAVSCVSSARCFAVGYTGNAAGTSGRTFAESWNGKRWTIERTPRQPGAAASFLSGISCVSMRSCVAAGFVNRTTGPGSALIERWNGTAWSADRVPNPAGATSVQLSGISCASASACTAVGFFTIVTGIEVMIAERWDGVRWTLDRTLYPRGARFVQLSGVSCAAPGECTAVGLFNNIAGIDVTLAETRRTDTWTIERTPHPPGSTDASLAAVSCVSASLCTAVGGSTTPDGTPVTLVIRRS